MEKPKAERVLLAILDGWGHGPDPKVSAIAQADTPFVDSLYKGYPHSELLTHGEDVGLPAGQMGNSEVGHLNIGAGRIVYQELLRINNAIRDDNLRKEPTLLELLAYAKQHGKPLHLMGLVSDGGVHSHINHLKALCDIAADYGLEEVYIHAFMDGRDTSPTGGAAYLEDLLAHIQGSPVRLASVIGRYYAMDRDKRWERVRLAYDLLVHGEGVVQQDAVAALRQSYAEGVTDEFVKPIFMENGATLQAGDAVLFFNFRTDRPRQLTEALTQRNFPEQGMSKLPLRFVTMTRYDEDFKGLDVIFQKENLRETLGEVLAEANKTQTRIAETEKYPHVTFFFSGGREEPFHGERRIMVPSPKVPTYDLQPEMSAEGITDAIIAAMDGDTPDFICLNYANTDMVGHTGVFEAAVKAAETVDACLSRLTTAALAAGYALIIIADHGNSDYMVNPDGSPHTAHTTYPVPCFYVHPDAYRYDLHNGRLADVAPTILHLLGIPLPQTMTGRVLLGDLE